MLPLRARVDLERCNEGVLRIPQSSSTAGTSPSDCFVSCRTLVRGGGLTPLQSAVSVFYSPSRLGNEWMWSKAKKTEQIPETYQGTEKKNCEHEGDGDTNRSRSTLNMFSRYWANWRWEEEMKPFQPTTQLKSIRILRRVLEPEETCSLSDTRGKTHLLYLVWKANKT